MKFSLALVLTFGFLSAASATSLPEVVELESAFCTSGKIDRNLVLKNLEARAERYVTLQPLRLLALDARTGIAKSGHGIIESASKIMVVLPSTDISPYCTVVQNSVVIPVGTVIIKLNKEKN